MMAIGADPCARWPRAFVHDDGADWTKRCPRIVEEAARLREPLIVDAEVVRLLPDGITDFDAVALAFDRLLSGEDIRDRIAGQ